MNKRNIAKNLVSLKSGGYPYFSKEVLSVVFDAQAEGMITLKEISRIYKYFQTEEGYLDLDSDRQFRKYFFDREKKYTAVVVKIFPDWILLANVRAMNGKQQENGHFLWIKHRTGVKRACLVEGDLISFNALPYRYTKKDGRSGYSLKKIYDIQYCGTIKKSVVE